MNIYDSVDAVYDAIDKGKHHIGYKGEESLIIYGSKSRIHLYGSSRARVHEHGIVYAHDSSTVYAHDSSTVYAHDSSTVYAHDSSTVYAHNTSMVRTYDISIVHAYHSSTVHAYHLSTVHAHGTKCVIFKHNTSVSINNATNVIDVLPPKNLIEWAERYDVKLDGTKCVLYKAVDNEYRSPYGCFYVPGTIPVAPDWDGGKEECGGGLHFCASPGECLEFVHKAERFIACPVDLKDAVFHDNASYPQKVKVSGCCGPVWEVDIDGHKV